MKESIDLTSCKASLIERGIVHLEMKEVKVTTLQHIVQVYDAVEQLGGGEKMGLLTTFEGYIPGVTKEAYDYSGSARVKSLATGTAYVIDNFALRILVKFFMKFYKQIIPRKIFDNKKDAMEWLRKLRDQKKT